MRLSVARSYARKADKYLKLDNIVALQQMRIFAEQIAYAVGESCGLPILDTESRKAFLWRLYKAQFLSKQERQALIAIWEVGSDAAHGNPLSESATNSAISSFEFLKMAVVGIIEEKVYNIDSVDSEALTPLSPKTQLTTGIKLGESISDRQEKFRAKDARLPLDEESVTRALRGTSARLSGENTGTTGKVLVGQKHFRVKSDGTISGTRLFIDAKMYGDQSIQHNERILAMKENIKFSVEEIFQICKISQIEMRAIRGNILLPWRKVYADKLAKKGEKKIWFGYSDSLSAMTAILGPEFEVIFGGKIWVMRLPDITADKADSDFDAIVREKLLEILNKSRSQRISLTAARELLLKTAREFVDSGKCSHHILSVGGPNMVSYMDSLLNDAAEVSIPGRKGGFWLKLLQ